MKATALKPAFAALLALAATSTASAQQQIDFKGNLFGSTVAEFLAKQPEFVCGSDGHCGIYPTLSCKELPMLSSQRKECEREIDAKKTYGGVPVTSIRVSFTNNQLARVLVSFNSQSFATLNAALIAKFGPPTSVDRPEARNRAGAVFNGEDATWKAGNVTLTARKYAGSLDRSVVEILSDTYAAQLRQDAEKAKEKNVKDI